MVCTSMCQEPIPHVGILPITWLDLHSDRSVVVASLRHFEHSFPLSRCGGALWVFWDVGARGIILAPSRCCCAGVYISARSRALWGREPEHVDAPFDKLGLRLLPHILGDLVVVRVGVH